MPELREMLIRLDAEVLFPLRIAYDRHQNLIKTAGYVMLVVSALYLINAIF